jgi:hypothetical protein
MESSFRSPNKEIKANPAVNFNVTDTHVLFMVNSRPWIPTTAWSA